MELAWGWARYFREGRYFPSVAGGWGGGGSLFSRFTRGNDFFTLLSGEPLLSEVCDILRHEHAQGAWAVISLSRNLHSLNISGAAKGS